MIRYAPCRAHARRYRQISAALTRRQAIVSAGLLTVVPLVGCGSTDEPAAPEGRTITTDSGAITIPPEPERVVVTDIYLVNSLYDLGLRPVGIPSGLRGSGALAPEVEEWLGDEVAEIGAAGEINRDSVLAVEPDLIIDQFYPDATAALTKVAPVAFFDWRTTGNTWREQEPKVADALNKSSELHERTESYDQRIAELTETYPSAWKRTWAVAAGSANGDWVLGAVVVELLNDLGATTVDKLTTGYATYSMELLGMLADGDVICYPLLFDGKAPQPTADLIGSKQFKALPAAEAGNVYGLRYTGVGCYFQALRALDELEAIATEIG